MSLTQAQINEAFKAMGLPPPSSAVVSSLEAIAGDQAALETIITLPEVVTDVIPVVSMFDLALGHDPTSSTLAQMVGSGESVAQLASDFVASQTFANEYNGGVLLNPNAIVDSSNAGIITALFVNGLGHAPTPATLSQFFGATLAEAFLEFTTSETVAVSTTVDHSLLSILGLATGVPISFTNPPINQSFTLTNGSDTVIVGQPTVGTTTPGVTVTESTTNDPVNTTINAPLSGPFGHQPTLTSGDDINLSAGANTAANTLNALFDGSDTVTGLTIQGVQTWNISQAAGGSLFIQGAPGALDGVTSLTFNGDGLDTQNLQVGIFGAGIDATTSANNFNLTINNVAANNVSGVVTLYFAPTAFNPAGGDTINVTANAVSNNMGGNQSTQQAALWINAGSGGSAGFTNWNVTSTNSNSINDIALGALGSTAARTLTVSDTGPTTNTIIWSVNDAADWAQLTTIDAVGTLGTLTVTGAENGASGLLAQDTSALTLVEGGGGADTFDLSAFGGATGGSVAGLSILGGANTTIELSNTEINFVSAAGAAPFAEWLSVAALDDVGVGGASAVGGAFNMAEFPGTLVVNLLSDTSGTTGINQTAAIDVTNAPNGLTFNFNETNQHGNNFSIIGASTAGGASNVVTVDYTAPEGSTGTFSSQNFDKVDVNISGSQGNFGFGGAPAVDFYSGGITAIANADAAETLTINATETFVHNIVIPVPPFVEFGVVSPSTIDVGNTTSTDVGLTSIDLQGGGITVQVPVAFFNETGTLDISGTDNVVVGGTNAFDVASTTSGTFDMTDPDTDILFHSSATTFYGGVTASSTSADSILQGSWGAEAGPGITTAVGDDTLTDLAGGSNFYGDGGMDTIKIGGGGNTVHIGSILFGDDGFTIFTETGTNEAALGFWGASHNGQLISANSGAIFGTAPEGGTSTDLTTITGFTLGTGGDNLNFNPAAWSDSGNPLLNAHSGAAIPVGSNAGGATFAVGFAGETITTSADLVLDEIGGQTFSGAAALAQALHTETVGNINLGFNVAAHSNAEFLVAYSTGSAINIADVLVFNTTGSNQTDTGNAGMHVYASDLVSLSGQTSLTTLGINASEIHFHSV